MEEIDSIERLDSTSGMIHRPSADTVSQCKGEIWAHHAGLLKYASLHG